jgi:hypothetical protein
MIGEHEMKETTEAAEGAGALLGFVFNRCKDGADLGDAKAAVEKMIVDAEFRKLMIRAAEGAQKIPSEGKKEISIDGFEGLTQEMLFTLSRALKAFMKEFRP